jgi:hypothetical protein
MTVPLQKWDQGSADKAASAGHYNVRYCVGLHTVDLES